MVGVAVAVGVAVGVGVGVIVVGAVLEEGSCTAPFDWRVTEVCVDALATFM
jgi:hypothetical protein